MKEWNGKRLLTRFQVDDFGESLTVQSDMHGADIRNVISRYTQGVLEKDLAQAELDYADVSSFTDFADVMRTAKTAERDFMKLPSKVREVFAHDVAKWLDASHDHVFSKEQADALVKLGYLEAAKAADSGSDLGDAVEGGTLEE